MSREYGESGWTQTQPGVWQPTVAPAFPAPAAEADLREQITQGIRDRINMRPVWTAERLADHLLAGPLQLLIEQAAEAARLRETVARVSAELNDLAESRDPADRLIVRILRRALDGEDTT